MGEVLLEAGTIKPFIKREMTVSIPAAKAALCMPCKAKIKNDVTIAAIKATNDLMNAGFMVWVLVVFLLFVQFFHPATGLPAF